MNSNNLLSIIEISKTDSQLLSYLSEITSEDKYLLQKTVRKIRHNSKNYEDSWGYVIQATRYNGFKWYDPNTDSLIFFGRKNKNDTTLVVPAYVADAEYLTYIVTRIQKALGAQKTILKNVNLEDISKLNSFGFRIYNNDEYWSTDARFDDQTFPQLIVDLKMLKNPIGRKYQNLRTVFNKKLKLKIRKYQNSDKLHVFNLFNSIDKKYHLDGVYFASHAMYPAAALHKYVITDEDEKEILGFTATSSISSISCGLVAALFMPSSNASVWGIYQTLMAMYDGGYQFGNLGGCETKGTHNFMRRTFRPIEQLAKTHMIYEL